MSLGQMFSQRFGYAAHALAYMAKKPFGALTTLPEMAGWMQSVLASPMFARCDMSFAALMNLLPASIPPLMPKPTIAPHPFGRYRFAFA